MKKLYIVICATFIIGCYGQGTRFQPGTTPSPSPVYNVEQIVSNILAILGTNFESNLGSLTNLPVASFNNGWDRFVFANTNAAGTNINQVVTYQTLSNALASAISFGIGQTAVTI